MKFILILCFLLSYSYVAQAQDGILIKCGASEGTGYFFHDEVVNPDGPFWHKDALSTGKITLVRLGDEWDILFDDILGGNSYRRDGAKVILLGHVEHLLTVGAFFQNSYAEIYTFDFLKREVAWSSNKIGAITPKVAVYHATCD